MSHGKGTISNVSTRSLSKLSNRTVTPNGGGLAAKVQKQVIRVKGQRDDVLVNLYIRLAIPNSDSTQSLPLFSEKEVNLRVALVCPVTSKEGGRGPIIPHDAPRSLHRAAEALFSAKPIANGLNRDERARIATSSSQITFMLEGENELLGKSDERLHYIAFIQISVPYASKPPAWPYIVQIPVARCLYNCLHFEGDETCLDIDTVVEVDPPLLSKPVAPPLSRQNSNDTAELLSADADGDSHQSLSGPFFSTSSLTLRWARASAGKMVNGLTAIDGLTRISGELLRVSATYSNARKVNCKSIEVDVDASISLLGASCPSLDATATLALSLVGGSWVPDTVSTRPTTAQDAAVFHSFSNTSSMTSPLDVKKPATQHQHRANGKPSSVRECVLDQRRDDIDTTLDEGSIILNARPPKGLASSGLDSGSDDDYPSSSPSKRQADRRRRYSLGNGLSAERIEALALSSTESDAQELLHILLKTTPLSLGSSNFTCQLQGKALLRLYESTADEDVVELPHIRSKGIPLQFEASFRDLDWRIKQHGSQVRVTNADRASTYEIVIAALSSTSEETSVVAQIGVSNPEKVTGASPPTSDTDSLGSFVNTTLQIERNLGARTQATQIEALSGIIQQASVEITAKLVQPEEALLQANLPLARVMTTNRIRATWPSRPAPSSGWLPQMVFAIPSVEGCDLQVLYAGINGLCADVKEDTEQIRKSTSRMIDLKLPASLTQAPNIDVFLVYTQESTFQSTFCAFPLVASSIAELTVMIECESLLALRPVIDFALPPLHLHQKSQEVDSRLQITALMLPSMNNVVLTMREKPVAPLAIVASDNGPLRRSTKNSRTKEGKRWTVLHLLFTAMLAIAVRLIWQSTEPLLKLQDKVDSLALALNVDFSEGTWTPEATSLEHTLPQYLISGTETSERPLSVERRRIRPFKRTTGPNELSIETRSYVQILQSIPIKAGRAILWPLRFLYKLIS